MTSEAKPFGLRWSSVLILLGLLLTTLVCAALIGCWHNFGARDQEELASLADRRMSECVRAVKAERKATCGRASQCAVLVLSASEAVQTMLEERAAGGSVRVVDEIAAAGKIRKAHEGCEPIRIARAADGGLDAGRAVDLRAGELGSIDLAVRPMDMRSIGPALDSRPALDNRPDGRPLDSRPHDMAAAPVAWILAIFGWVAQQIEAARARKLQAEAERGRAAVKRARQAVEVAERETRADG